MFRVILAAICLAASLCSASAQSSGDDSTTWSKPSVGGTIEPQDEDTFQPSGSEEILRHRDFAGKPCLTVSGYARPHTIDPNLYDDVVSLSNSCPRQISVKVCYYESEDCVLVDVPGSERKEVVLGMLPSIKDFKFEFREKFDD